MDRWPRATAGPRVHAATLRLTSCRLPKYSASPRLASPRLASPRRASGSSRSSSASMPPPRPVSTRPIFLRSPVRPRCGPTGPAGSPTSPATPPPASPGFPPPSAAPAPRLPRGPVPPPSRTLRSRHPARGHFGKPLLLSRRFVLRQPRQVVQILRPPRRRVLQSSGVIECSIRRIPRRPEFRGHQPMQARPRPRRQLRDRPELRTHGIEMNRVAQRIQPSRRIDQQTLVATLEQMPPLAPQPVEARGEHALQPLHALDPVGPRGRHRQVRVIRPRHHACTRQPVLSHASSSQVKNGALVWAS